MTTVYSYTPCSSVVPYDYHGTPGAKDIQEKLQTAGIDSFYTEKKRRIDNPIGSGRCGAVRCGDEMLPSTYLINVRDEDAEKARRILVHKLDSFSRDRIVKILATDTKKDENLF